MSGDDRDTGERNLPPTTAYRLEARRRGRVARSSDASAVMLLLASMASLWLFGPKLLAAMASLLSAMLSPDRPILGLAQTGSLLSEHLANVAWLATGLAMSLVAAALAINIAQVGITLSTKPLAPDAQRVEPSRNFGEIFSADSLVKLLGTLAKVTAVGLIGYGVLRGLLPQLGQIGLMAPISAASYVAKLLASMCWPILAVLAVLAASDYLYRRWRHEKDLMMTRRERIEELRRTQGGANLRKRRQ